MMRLLWTKRAVNDLHQVREHIRLDSPAAAARTGERIESATSKLLQQPEMGRKGEVPGTRELVIPGLPYIVVYRVQSDKVQILRIFHSKQKWPDAF